MRLSLVQERTIPNQRTFKEKELGGWAVEGDWGTAQREGDQATGPREEAVSLLAIQRGVRPSVRFRKREFTHGRTRDRCQISYERKKKKRRGK